MPKAFGEIAAADQATALTFPEWLGRLLERETTYHYDRKLARR
jgi:hypothetical protein